MDFSGTSKLCTRSSFSTSPLILPDQERFHITVAIGWLPQSHCFVNPRFLGLVWHRAMDYYLGVVKSKMEDHMCCFRVFYLPHLWCGRCTFYVKLPTQLCLPHIHVRLHVCLYLSVCVWDGIVPAITDCQELQASSKQTHFDKVQCFHLVIKYKSVRLREEILIVQITTEWDPT